MMGPAMVHTPSEQRPSQPCGPGAHTTASEAGSGPRGDDPGAGLRWLGEIGRPPIALLLVTGLGGLLRFWQLGTKGMWLDEAFSVWMARHPLAEMLGWIARIDQHPPLYYLLLHLWLALGDDPATVRALSALFSTLTVPVVYALGHRLAGPRVGLLAALLLALAPFHVRFAQEARMYALLTFSAALAMLALVHLLTDPRAAQVPLGSQLIRFIRDWRAASPGLVRSSLPAVHTDLAWLGYILATAAALWTQHTAIFLPLATNGWVLGLWVWRRRRPTFSPDLILPSPRNWLWAQAAILLLWSPWIPVLLYQAWGVYREFWIPAPSLATVWRTLQTFFSAHFPLTGAWSAPLWFGYLLLLGLGGLRLRRQPARLALLLALWLTPFVGELAVSLRRPIFYDRTLLWASIPVYLLLALGVVHLRARPWMLAVLALLIGVNGLSLHRYYRHFQKEQWREAAAYVAQRVRDEDLLLFHGTWVQIPFDYYFRAYDRPVARHGVPVDLFERGVLEPKMTRADLPRLRERIRGFERVWLIYSHDWYTDPEGLIPRTLDQELELVERRGFYGLEVRLYRRPPRAPAP